jgi:hypothetical protein
MMKTKLLMFLLPLFAVACGASATSTPRIRVARDLGCTAENTTIGRIDKFRWEVTGCGLTAVYMCTYPVRDCWREGEIRRITTE